MNEPVTRARQAIAEQAAEWFVELQEKPPPRSVKLRFTAWLTESPAHVEEYLAVAKIFGALRHVDPKAEIAIAALVDETVVALHGESGRLIKQGRRDGGRQPRFWASAAGVVLAIAAAVLYIRDTRPEAYTTAVGEQRSVLLEDGSMVSLNTSTTIEVTITEQTRQVRLTQGEALFDVEEDAARPFLVETGSAVIRVTGTRFNVYERADSTAVTVLKGEVEVRRRQPARGEYSFGRSAEGIKSSAGDVARLSIGDQAIVKSGSAEIEKMTVASLESVTAWTTRRLVFDSTPLSDIVRQFNRYNHQRLVLDDTSLASLELSGVFDSNDPESLILFLRRIADVEVTTSSDGNEIRIHAASASR